MARLKTKFRSSPEGQELYEKTIQLMMRERTAEVVAVFREYFAKYHAVPPEAPLVFRLAEALQREGETDLCIHCLERLVELPDVSRPVREKSLFQLATLLEFTSCFEAARCCFARFAAEYPASLLAEKARERAGGEVHTPPRPVPPLEQEPAEACPACGGAMVVRQATAGANKGRMFRVCGRYPDCRTFLPVPEAAEFSSVAPQRLPERYRLVFDGSIAMASDPEETKENIARLFQCGRERVDKLFGGGRTVLKRELDKAAALKMKEAFDRTGAICILEAEEPPAAALKPPVPGPSPPVAPQTVEEAPPPPPARPDFACPKCGHLQEKGESCEKCGVFFAKLAHLAERDFHSFRDHLPGGAARPVMSETHERRWAMCCHLMVLSGFLIPFGNVLGPLAVWLWKRKESEFIDFHGKTALNYQITLLLFLVGSTLVAACTGFALLFVGPVFGILSIYSLAMIATSAVRSSRGEYVEIALSAEFIK